MAADVLVLAGRDMRPVASWASLQGQVVWFSGLRQLRCALQSPQWLVQKTDHECFCEGKWFGFKFGFRTILLASLPVRVWGWCEDGSGRLPPSACSAKERIWQEMPSFARAPDRGAVDKAKMNPHSPKARHCSADKHPVVRSEAAHSLVAGYAKCVIWAWFTLCC